MVTEPRAPRLPPSPGAREIVDALRNGEPGSAEIYEAFEQLDALPADEVREALASWVGPPREGEQVDEATKRALGLPLPPLHLRTLSVAKDADLLDLGPVAEDQLRVAGRSWDGADMPAEERLDGEIEGSFAGTVERRVLSDADASERPPLFDVVLFAEEAGAVFAAGTTTIVGYVAYGKVEMRDRRARVAIEKALSSSESDAATAATKPTPTRTRAAKKASAKKPAAKKPAAKKPAAKKPAEKKPAAKKPSPKRVSAKKPPTKKRSSKVT